MISSTIAISPSRMKTLAKHAAVNKSALFWSAILLVYSFTFYGVNDFGLTANSIVSFLLILFGLSIAIFAGAVDNDGVDVEPLVDSKIQKWVSFFVLNLLYATFIFIAMNLLTSLFSNNSETLADLIYANFGINDVRLCGFLATLLAANLAFFASSISCKIRGTFIDGKTEFLGCYVFTVVILAFIIFPSHFIAFQN